jgi:hypothetical protein
VNFNTFRIEPMRYRIQTERPWYLKTWAVEDSDDGASPTKMDGREKNSDPNAPEVVKIFAVWRSGSFGRIRLCQTESPREQSPGS